MKTTKEFIAVELNHYILTRSGQTENGYGPFIAEILHSEGLMSFKRVDLDMQDMPEFHCGDIVVVTRYFLRKAEIDLILKAAEDGAGVVLIQPSIKLAKRIGLDPVCKVVYPGYLRLDVNGRMTQVQVHVPIDIYKQVESWNTLAESCGSDFESLGPAIMAKKIGKGAIAVYAYDLPKTIARIRFGNPDMISLATSGWPWPHANDLFCEQLDERFLGQPQADIHAQFFAKVLTDACPYPLMRIWYYENAEQSSACVFQSDGDLSAVEQFDALSAALEKHGGSATFFLMPGTKLNEAKVADMRSRGHTFGPHVDATASIREQQLDELYFEFPRELKDQTDNFKNRFGKCSRTIQSHFAPWMGYMNWVGEHVKNGYRMLFANLGLKQAQWGVFVCGSSRPMKYFAPGRECYDCWQQPIVFYDDSTVIEWFKTFDGPTRHFDNFLDAAIDENHSVVSCLSHPVSFATYSSPVMEHIMDSLVDNQIPIYNGDEWLSFNERRDQINVRYIIEQDGNVSYEIENIKGRFVAIVPDCKKPLVVNKKNADTISRKISGQEYMFVQLDEAVNGTSSEIKFN